MNTSRKLGRKGVKKRRLHERKTAISSSPQTGISLDGEFKKKAQSNLGREKEKEKGRECGENHKSYPSRKERETRAWEKK